VARTSLYSGRQLCIRAAGEEEGSWSCSIAAAAVRARSNTTAHNANIHAKNPNCSGRGVEAERIKAFFSENLTLSSFLHMHAVGWEGKQAAYRRLPAMFLEVVPVRGWLASGAKPIGALG
jgi:hypothetical protein